MVDFLSKLFPLTEQDEHKTLLNDRIPAKKDIQQFISRLPASKHLDDPLSLGLIKDLIGAENKKGEVELALQETGVPSELSDVDGSQVKNVGMNIHQMEDDDFLVCNPTVLGFNLNDKWWCDLVGVRAVLGDDTSARCFGRLLSIKRATSYILKIPVSFLYRSMPVLNVYKATCKN